MALAAVREAAASVQEAAPAVAWASGPVLESALAVVEWATALVPARGADSASVWALAARGSAKALARAQVQEPASEQVPEPG